MARTGTTLVIALTYLTRCRLNVTLGNPIGAGGRPMPGATSDIQTGTLAAIRRYYIKAAAYDAAFARYADSLDRRDQAIRLCIAAVTAVTSLGAFGSLFVNNPAWWAKLVVFSTAAATSVLTAVHRDARWRGQAERARHHGAKWTHQRNAARNLAARLVDGDRAAEQELAGLSAEDEDLVNNNPAISRRLYGRCKAEKAREFDRDFHYPRADARHRHKAPAPPPSPTE